MGVNKIPIIFFGSGPVAAHSLRLLMDNFYIEAVITKPQPKHHRGVFPVIDFASRNNIPLHTVCDKHSLEDLFTNKSFDSNVAVLIDFGIIVTQSVIDYFSSGIVNSHFSILPEWRGADPITFSLLSGQKETGVSLMLLAAGMDLGPIIAYRKLPIDANETNLSLTNKLIELSNSLLVEQLPNHITNPRPVEQIEAARASGNSMIPTYSRKLFKRDGHIEWTKPASRIDREVRAYLDWPRSFTRIGKIEVIITETCVSDIETLPEIEKPGTIRVSTNKLLIACADKFLEIKKIKPAGKKEMDIHDFISGYLNQIQNTSSN